MLIARRTLKFLGFFAVCLSFLVCQGLLRLAFRFALRANRDALDDRVTRAQLRFESARLVRFFSQAMLRVLNMEVKQYGTAPRPRAGHLIVCNHLSFTDVLMIASRSPCLFVTSMEVRDSFGLGHLCRLAGCLFVERRSRENIAAEVREISDALEGGVNVVVFPEATSTNGESVLPFKKSLFAAAIHARKPVTPACLNYRSIDGRPVDASNRDAVFYYGEMEFIPTLWSLCALRNVVIDLHFFDPIHPIRVIDHKELTFMARAPIEKHFRPVASEHRARVAV